MNKQLSFYILIICLTGSLVTCKSGKVSVPESKQTSKEVENVKSSTEAGNKEEQTLQVDTTKNLKSLKEESTSWNKLDSIKNGYKVYWFDGYVKRTDSTPKILTELFPEAYFAEFTKVMGYAPMPVLFAFCNNQLFTEESFDDFADKSLCKSKLTKEQKIISFLAMESYGRSKSVLDFTIINQRLNNIDYEYSVDMKTPSGVIEIWIAFRYDGTFFYFLDKTNNETYKKFKYGNQYE